MSSMGTKVERQFVNDLDEAGFRVMRSPSSGSGTGRDQPDVLAGRHGHSWAFEVKYRSSDRLQLSREEVEALESFAGGFGAKPLIAARWRGDTTVYLHSTPGLRQTRGGNFVITREDSEREAEATIDDFLLYGGLP